MKRKAERQDWKGFGSFTRPNFGKLRPRNVVDRGHPIEFILFLGILLIILGGIFSVISVVLWVGVFIIALYILYFFLWKIMK